MKLGLIALTCLMLFSAPLTHLYAADWKIDAAHSEVGFKVRHLGISNVRGFFGKFEGTFSYDENAVENSKVNALIDVSSINTNNAKRDKHLRSCDFFCLEKFAQMTFTSKEIKKGSGSNFQIIGELDLHGVKKTVTLDAELLGKAQDDFGNKRIAFSAETTLNRKDFGLKWNDVTETGGLLVGEVVTLQLEITGTEVKKAA